MKNVIVKSGVKYDADRLARLSVYWFENTKAYKNWGWIRWQTQLLSGELEKRNPVQINSENFRKRKSCKQA